MLVSAAQFNPGSSRGFIVLEGVNGAGKTTLQSKIITFLEASGQKAISTREPGATDLGKTIRQLVLEPRPKKISDTAEMMLFGADRAEHVDKVVLPALSKNTWVISDRYYYSTIAFQGYARRIDMDIVRQIAAIAIGGTLPDLVLLLDLDPLEGLRRATGRHADADGNDRFEAEAIEFHSRVREGFLAQAKTLPEPFAILDATQSSDKVFEQAKPFLQALIRAKGRPA